MINPWDIRPKAKRGNTADEIHLAVGRALTQWERLEHRVGEIYGALISPGRYSHVAVRAYGVVAASSGRLEMVKEAAKVSIPLRQTPDLQRRVLNFLTRVGKYSARRNEIAHGVAVTYGGDQTDIRLMPAFYNSRKIPNSTEGPAYLYAADDIIHYQEQFHMMNIEAQNLMYEIEQLPILP